MPKGENVKFRRILSSSFSSMDSQITAVKQHCSTIKATITDEKHFEFVETFCPPLEDSYAQMWLKTSPEQLAFLKELLMRMRQEPKPDQEMVLWNHLSSELAARRANPLDDICSRLMADCPHHKNHDADLLVLLSTALSSSAQQITTHLLTHCVLAISQDLELQAQLARESFEGIRCFAKEVARWEPITQVIPRVATRNTCLADVQLKPGQKVLLVLTSICRDESHHPRADSINRFRPEPSLAFGRGSHSCVGETLALNFTTTILEEIIKDCVVVGNGSPPEFSVDFGRTCRRLMVTLKKRKSMA